MAKYNILDNTIAYNVHLTTGVLLIINKNKLIGVNLTCVVQKRRKPQAEVHIKWKLPR